MPILKLRAPLDDFDHQEEDGDLGWGADGVCGLSRMICASSCFSTARAQSLRTTFPDWLSTWLPVRGGTGRRSEEALFSVDLVVLLQRQTANSTLTIACWALWATVFFLLHLSDLEVAATPYSDWPLGNCALPPLPSSSNSSQPTPYFQISLCPWLVEYNLNHFPAQGTE